MLHVYFGKQSFLYTMYMNYWWIHFLLYGQLSHLEFEFLTPGILDLKFHLLHASFLCYACSFRFKVKLCYFEYTVSNK